jgi:dTDP-4-dehydrorhamnose reductase
MSYLKEKKIVVFGASGRLGKELVPLLKKAGANVITPTHEEVDISTGQVWRLICDVTPDLVINLAAYTDVAGAESSTGRIQAYKINTRGNQMVCEASKFIGAKVIYISSDYVYGGTKGWNITGQESPKTSYGMTKYLGEWFCDKEKDLIIRTSFKARGTWGSNAYKKVFHPVFTNADWVDIIAEKIVSAIEANLRGIINLGTERKLLLDLAKQDYPEVEISNVFDAKLHYKYPIDCSMILSQWQHNNI